MFVEGEISVKILDKDVLWGDDHALKLWLHDAFMGGCCYQITKFRTAPATQTVRANVTLQLNILDDAPQRLAELEGSHQGLARLLEGLFTGEGQCRVVGELALRDTYYEIEV